MTNQLLLGRDSAWERLFADVEWQFLADESDRSSLRWNERPELVQRMASMVAGYALLQADRIDTIPKLAEWIDHELQNPWIERVVRERNVSHADLLRPKADRAREIAAKVASRTPELPPLPPSCANAADDLLAIRNWCDGMAPQTPAQNHVLHRDDLRILSALARSKTTIMQYELEQDPHVALSRRTICERLKRLRDAGLTYRPNGERGGEAITPAGRQCLAADNAGR